MRIIVCIKQVVDLDQIRMKRETREPIESDVPLVIGQIEKHALEEAAKIKEKHKAEVVALAVGWPLADDVTLECMARAADRAVTVEDQALADLSSQGIVSVLAKGIEKIGDYDIILMGEGSTDNNSGQAGPAIAQLLGLPLVSHVRKLEVAGNKVRAVESLEDCYESVEAAMPLVVTVNSEINEPRIPSIIEVMDSSSKPHEKCSLADIGLTPEELKQYMPVKVLSNRYPEQVRKNILLKEGTLDKSVDMLLHDLAKEGVLEI